MGPAIPREKRRLQRYKPTPSKAERIENTNQLFYFFSVVVFLLALLSFFPALSGEFLNWDDEPNLVTKSKLPRIPLASATMNVRRSTWDIISSSAG